MKKIIKQMIKHPFVILIFCSIFVYGGLSYSVNAQTQEEAIKELEIKTQKIIDDIETPDSSGSRVIRDGEERGSAIYDRRKSRTGTIRQQRRTKDPEFYDRFNARQEEIKQRHRERTGRNLFRPEDADRLRDEAFEDDFDIIEEIVD